MRLDLSALTTEQFNERTEKIDRLTTLEMITIMNDEDRTVGDAVRLILPQIAAAVEAIYLSLKTGGRLFYSGAGTSGRIGILDASECPPTFCTPPGMVQAIIAGGERAMVQTVEGAEDNEEEGARDLAARNLTSSDVVVGIAASGRTPYAMGALKYAGQVGATTIAVSCNANAAISQFATHKIEAVTGPEIIAGSTRLKAATAQKMILNMLTTATMIKLGKVYGNLMVDLQLSNKKLRERARHMLATIAGVSHEEAGQALEVSGDKVKPAVVMLMAGVSYETANRLLEQADGFIHKAVEQATERLES
ncbi:N-acetylmuramic acid 6-phosphate etherase [Paenibacillus sp. J2TS4]|uniref:N-acetylmuramic acid 6-phosphate etherase n=1 Tax=Paenibacillus sp. J2TS4 TaxID=2807194 RepID=UPI001B0CC644|nr:N-acetylmuramic acid 6-phosphate etherase [Paenibacillus sp. J2TS4]GIP31136.1 N-acetylmuramic acid 6-phosphate etherase [Paenibacillus sp. J2TS4]